MPIIWRRIGSTSPKREAPKVVNDDLIGPLLKAQQLKSESNEDLLTGFVN